MNSHDDAPPNRNQEERTGFDPNKLLPSSEMYHHNHLPDYDDDPDSRMPDYRRVPPPSRAQEGHEHERQAEKDFQEMDSLPLGRTVLKIGLAYTACKNF